MAGISCSGDGPTIFGPANEPEEFRTLEASLRTPILASVMRQLGEGHPSIDLVVDAVMGELGNELPKGMSRKTIAGLVQYHHFVGTAKRELSVDVDTLAVLGETLFEPDGLK